MTIGAGENVDVTDLLVQHHGTGKHKGVDNLQNAPSASAPASPVVGDVWVEPIPGGSGATATAAVTAGAIASITVTAGGDDYSSVPTVTLAGGTPSTDAVLVAAIDGNGTVTGVTVSSEGAGYSAVPTVSFTDPNTPGRLQVCYANGSFTQVTSGSSAAGLVQVSSSDNTPGYLLGKLVQGDNILLTKGNEGGNETLTIDALVPTNIIAHYLGASAPDGWEIYTAAVGRVILGMDASWTLAEPEGTAFASNGATRTITEVPNHVHSVNPPSTASSPDGDHNHTSPHWGGSNDLGITRIGGNQQGGSGTLLDAAPTHTHNVDIAAFNSENNTSGVASVDVTMPYVQLLPIKKDVPES